MSSPTSSIIKLKSGDLSNHFLDHKDHDQVKTPYEKRGDSPLERVAVSALKSYINTTLFHSQNSAFVTPKKISKSIEALVKTSCSNDTPFFLLFPKEINSLVFRLAFSSMKSVIQPNLGFDDIVCYNEIIEKTQGLKLAQQIVNDPCIKLNRESLPKIEFTEMFPNFNPTDTETFTACSWNELFKSAKEKNLPTYCLTVTICQDHNKFVYQAYDAIAFRNYTKSQKPNPQFPLGCDSITRLKILWTVNFEIQCFQLNSSMIAEPVDLKASNFRQFFEKQVPGEIIILKNRTITLGAFALDGCNHAAPNNKEEFIGRIQYTVGLTLLNLSKRPLSPKYIEAWRWLYCAAKNHIQEAQKKINTSALT